MSKSCRWCGSSSVLEGNLYTNTFSKCKMCGGISEWDGVNMTENAPSTMTLNQLHSKRTKAFQIFMKITEYQKTGNMIDMADYISSIMKED